MSLAVTLNGSSVNFKRGITIKEKLSEDLDTGFLIIPQVESLTVEPFDQVVITDALGETPYYTKRMLVSDIRRVTSDFSTPKYNYELSLISPTIQLQRIVLPNRTITQPLTGSKTSIYTILSQYVSMYASDFTISSALQTLTTSVDCPEFQWNRPTLFEVFNDLLSEVDCVVTMSTFTEISYLELNPTGSTFASGSNVTINEEVLTHSAIDYANKLDAEVENSIFRFINTRTINWIVPKTDEDALVTTDNFKLILEKPIYKINSITAKIVPDGTTDYYTVDITDYIVEKSVYDLLAPSNSTGIISGDYKRDRIYYTEGSNIIDGLNYHEDTWLSISSKKAIINLFVNAYLAEYSVDLTAILDSDDYLRFAFKVDYIAQETVRVISNKTNTLKNDSVLINSQEQSYVNYERFANKQQLTADRLGNEKLEITGKLTTLLSKPDLGDNYKTDYKVAELEYSIYEDYVNYKAGCYENYVLKNIFTGLKQERRFTKIAIGSEAVESHHITELDFNMSNTSASTDATLEKYILTFGKADTNVNVVYFTTDKTSNIYGVAPSYYMSKNSISLVFKMYDNYNVGISSETTISWSGTKIGLQNAPYVDDDGKFNTFDLKLYKTVENEYLERDTYNVSYPYESGLSLARNYPIIRSMDLDSGDLIYSSTGIYRYKDNKEITVETIQFNIKTDSNIGYTSLFLQDSSFFYGGGTDIARRIAYSTTETYDKTDTTYKGTIDDGTYFTLTIGTNYYKIVANSTISVDDLASWAIVGTTGTLYIYNNGNDDTIYMNKE